MANTVRTATLALAFVAFAAAACSETWEGVKEDTRDNVEATGEGMEKAGEKIQKQAD